MNYSSQIRCGVAFGAMIVGLAAGGAQAQTAPAAAPQSSDAAPQASGAASQAVMTQWS